MKSSDAACQYEENPTDVKDLIGKLVKKKESGSGLVGKRGIGALKAIIPASQSKVEIVQDSVVQEKQLRVKNMTEKGITKLAQESWKKVADVMSQETTKGGSFSGSNDKKFNQT